MWDSPELTGEFLDSFSVNSPTCLSVRGGGCSSSSKAFALNASLLSATSNCDDINIIHTNPDVTTIMQIME